MNKDELIRQNGLELSYLEYRPILYKLSHKYKNVFNNELEEALAEANIWFIECYDSYDKNKAHFSTYLYGVVENKFIDIARRKKREKATFIDIDELNEDELGFYDSFMLNDTSTNIDDLTKGQILRLDTYMYYQDFVDVLDTREQDIFKLYYYNNWSISEISKFMNLSEVRVKQLKNNSLILLEKERKDY